MCMSYNINNLFFITFILLSLSSSHLSKEHLITPPHQLDRKILRNQIPIRQQHHHINLKLHLEITRRHRRAREQPRKHHIYRNFHPAAHIALGNLNVLYLCRVTCVAVCAAARLDAHKLKFNGFDARVGVLDLDGASEGARDRARGRGEVAGDAEGGDVGVFADVFERVGGDGEGDGREVKGGLVGLERRREEEGSVGEEEEEERESIWYMVSYRYMYWDMNNMVSYSDIWYHIKTCTGTYGFIQ